MLKKLRLNSNSLSKKEKAGQEKETLVKKMVGSKDTQLGPPLNDELWCKG